MRDDSKEAKEVHISDGSDDIRESLYLLKKIKMRLCW